MPSYQDLMAGARRADAAGDAQAARRFLELAARERKPRVDGRAIEWVNKGIAGAVDGMANLANDYVANPLIRGAESVAGVDLPEVPKADLAGHMRSVGIGVAEGEADTHVERFLEGTGEAAAMILPAGGVVSGLRAGSGKAAALADDVAQQFAKYPVTGTVAELAGGGGERTGRGMAEDAGAGPTAQTLAGLGGALATAPLTAPVQASKAIPGLLDTALNKSPLLGRAYTAAKKKVLRDFAPYTPAGTFARASDRVRSLTADPNEAVSRLDAGPEFGLPPAQTTGDTGLMSLEHAVNATDATRMRGAETQNALASQNIHGAFRDKAADAGAARDFIEQRRDVLKETMRQSVVDARAKAMKSIETADPARDQMDNATLVRQEIQRAYHEVREAERALWEAIPAEHPIRTSNARAALDRAVERTPRAQRHGQDDVPGVAVALLGEDGLGDTTTVKELHGLYSRLREMSRNLRAGTAPRNNAARIADDIAKGILEDLGVSAPQNTALGAQVAEAIDFSRAMNAVYGQGSVARILGRTADGGEKIADALTLQTVGRGGNEAAQAVDDIRTAASGGITDAGIQDYLRGRFRDAAVRDGKVSRGAAETFLTANRATLDRYPQLADELRASIDAGRLAETAERRVAGQLKNLDNPRKSASAAFTNARVGEEIGTIFKAKDPAKAAASVRRAAARNASGEALDSLQGGLLDYLIKGAEIGSFDEMGNRAVSGNALISRLNDPKVMSVAKAILPQGEISRLRVIAREAQKLERSMRAPAASEIVKEPPSTFLTTAARMTGAGVGSKLMARFGGKGNAGVGLQAAQIGSGRATAILNNLTNDGAEQLLKDAVKDGALLRALLAGERSTKQKIRREERLIVEWFAGYAGAQLAERGED